MPLCALRVLLMLLHTGRGSAGRLLSEALLLTVDRRQSQMVSHLLGTLHHMLPAWHIAPLVHRFGAPSSDGRAWPESPRRSGTTLSGAGMLPASCFLHLSFVKYQHDAFPNVGGQPTLVSLQRRLHFTLHPPRSGLSNFPSAHEGGAFCDQLPCPLADSVLTGSHPSWSSFFHFYLFLVHFYGVVDSIKFGC